MAGFFRPAGLVHNGQACESGDRLENKAFLGKEDKDFFHFCKPLPRIKPRGSRMAVMEQNDITGPDFAADARSQSFDSPVSHVRSPA